MPSRIRSLPPDVVRAIAAGEVIDSVAAAVRELAENALDAGARRIVVSLWLDRWQVRIADDGEGMDLDDLQTCALPHSTSKLYQQADLRRIATLGFRGEALHSLAHLSQLEIHSRPRERANGWRVAYDARGRATQWEVAAIAPGTVMVVSELFGNLSGRREALSPAQQLRGVQTTLQHLALCHPQVTWQVEQGGKPWFTLSPGETARDILPQVLRGVHPSDFQVCAIALPEDPSQIVEVTAGLPDRCHRRRPDWVKVAINGRLVRSPELEAALLSAYARTLPRDRFPVCFAHLHLDPEFIDWNRHPAKSEIYLTGMELWQQRLIAAVERALHLEEGDMQTLQAQQRVVQVLKASESSQPYNAPGASILPLKAIAQANNTYIVAEHASGIWLVEQHIAHERILYEQLCDTWQLVALDPPIVLENLSEKQLERLRAIGMEVESFGEKLWAVRTIPAPLKDRSDRADALLELSSGDLQAAQVATACRTAIRNGTPLSLPEMQDILDRWQRTRHPRTCPHGRPIYLALEETSLSRFFRRHWVIGKSHGI